MKQNLLCILPFAILVALVYSSVWMQGLIKEHQDPVGFTYVPVVFGNQNLPGLDDESWYYTYVRKIVDGDFLPGPTEHGGPEQGSQITVPVHSSYYLSYFLSAIWGLPRSSSQDAFFVTTFLYPLINLVLFALIIMMLTGAGPLTALLPTVIFIPFGGFGGVRRFLDSVLSGSWDMNIGALTNMYRFPTLLTSGLQLLISLILIIKLARNPGLNWLLLTAAAIVTGSGTLFSVQNGLASASLTLGGMLAILMYQPPEKSFRISAAFAAGTLIFALPGCIHVLRILLEGGAHEYIQWVYDMPLAAYKIHRWDYFRHSVPYFLAVIPLLVLPFENKKLCLSLLIPLLFSFLFMEMYRGTFASGEYWQRGIFFVVAVILSSGYVGLLQSLNRFFFNREATPDKWLTGTGYILVAGLLLCAIKSQWQYNSLHLHKFNQKSLKGLYSWLKEQSDVKNFASLDFGLSLILSGYTHQRPFLPTILRSGWNEAGVKERLFHSLAFSGVNPLELKNYHAAMDYHVYQDEDSLKVRNFKYFHFLFYSLKRHHVFSKSEGTSLMNEYEIFLTNYNTDYLSEISDIWIDSDLSRFMLKEGSPAHKLVTSQQPLFENQKYRIYKIPGARSSVASLKGEGS